MNTALVLVDIQNDYFINGLWPVENMQTVAAAAANALKAARASGDHVIHIRHEALSSSAPFFRPATEGAEIHSSVAPEPHEAVVVKHRPNSFYETPLHSMLQAAGITQITIVGAMSQMCIDATARAARDLGYDVTVIADACGAKAINWRGQNLSAAQMQAAFMSALAQSYATII
ncbi:MAG: cysteine hydrolase family protein [Sulfitobacter sp.]